MASIVACMRGSVAVMQPTIGIIRHEASRSSEPKDCVNAPADSFQPRVRIASLISSVRPSTVDAIGRIEPSASWMHDPARPST